MVSSPPVQEREPSADPGRVPLGPRADLFAIVHGDRAHVAVAVEAPVGAQLAATVAPAAAELDHQAAAALACGRRKRAGPWGPVEPMGARRTLPARRGAWSGMGQRAGRQRGRNVLGARRALRAVAAMSGKYVSGDADKEPFVEATFGDLLAYATQIEKDLLEAVLRAVEKQLGGALPLALRTAVEDAAEGTLQLWADRLRGDFTRQA